MQTRYSHAKMLAAAEGVEYSFEEKIPTSLSDPTYYNNIS